MVLMGLRSRIWFLGWLLGCFAAVAGAQLPSAPPPGRSTIPLARIPRVSRAPRLDDFLQDKPREAELVIDDLGKYARANARDDDYSHRMMVNIAALVFVTALAAIAIWLASTMAQNRKNQDCVLSGRRNCVSIDPPALRDYAPP